jgi:hypothetical protein
VYRNQTAWHLFFILNGVSIRMCPQHTQTWLAQRVFWSLRHFKEVMVYKKVKCPFKAVLLKLTDYEMPLLYLLLLLWTILVCRFNALKARLIYIPINQERKNLESICRILKAPLDRLNMETYNRKFLLRAGILMAYNISPALRLWNLCFLSLIR